MSLPRSTLVGMFCVIAVLIVLTCFVLETIGGSGKTGGYTSKVLDFSLCTSDEFIEGRPRKLNSVVITPTSIIYACGYLQIENQIAGEPTCLLFDLQRNDRLILRYPDAYCTQNGSGYFIYAIKTNKLQVPAKYKLEVFDEGLKNWKENIAFEVR